MTLDFQDFQKQDIKFDISELQKAYKEVIKIKNFDGPEGISNFGAISLTQIPGDPDSIKGHKARGVFWTYPDSSGKEQIRDEKINEAAYSEFIDSFLLDPSIKNIGNIKSLGLRVFSWISFLDQEYFLLRLSLNSGYLPVIMI